MASLTESLYHLPTERLKVLVERRGIDPKKLALTPNKKQLANALMTELNRQPSISAAVVQCNARQLRLLQILTICEPNAQGGIPWRKIEDIAGGESLADALEKAAESLEEWGLAFRVTGGVFLPEAVKSQIPISLPDRYNLRRCLENYDAQTVKRIVRKLELHPSAETKVINVEAIADHLLGSSPGLKLHCPLDSEELETLEYLVALGGSAPAVELATSLYASSEDFFRYDWQNRWKTGRERNAIDRLLARGILHVIWYGYGYNLYVVIPGDLLRVVTGGEDNSFWTTPPAQVATLPAAPPHVTHVASMLRDVVTFLGHIAAHEAARTTTGLIHKTILKNAARSLRLPDERYASFLYALCREAGLIAPLTDRQVYSLTTKGAAWLQQDGMTQTRALFEAWRSGSTWAEMYNDPLRKAESYRPTESIVRLRRMVLNVVSESAPNVWHDLNSLTETLMFRAPLMLAAGAMLGPDLAPSPAVFVRMLAGECLLWLGLAELGYAAIPQPAVPEAPAPAKRGRKAEPAVKTTTPDAVAYRLTPLGAFLLELPNAAAPDPEPREDQFIVQANGEIFLSPYLEPVTLYRLLALTDAPAKEAASNTVLVTRDSIRRALDAGETPREILSFLQSHSRAGIPQNIEYLINEVGGKHGHIHIGAAQMYLKVDSPLLLQELMSRKELKNYFARTLDETIALVRADDPEKMLRDLRKAGYMPISDDAPRRPNIRLNTRPATPTDANAAPARPGRKPLQTGNALDWERIAQEDAEEDNISRQPTPLSPTEMPEGATRDQHLMKFLLSQCIQKKFQIDLAYLAPNTVQPEALTLEPYMLMDGYLNALNPATRQEGSYPYTSILWLRPTRRPFTHGR